MRVDQVYIKPEQLCIGLYIHLDLGWMDHPFTFSSFKIKSEEQIATIRQLGLSKIRYEPGKSDGPPSAEQPKPSVQSAPAPPAIDEAVLAEKRARVEQLNAIKAEIEAVEKKFRKAADTLKNISRNLHSRPQETMQEANELVSSMVESMLAIGDVKIHAMSQKLGEDVYFHALNVAVLSMVLAKAVDADADTLQQIGLGALFHDVGKSELPTTVTMKTQALNRAEQSLLETHCKLGGKLGLKLGLPESALRIVLLHHECCDGSGYPTQAKGEQLPQAVKIVALVNAYDNLCNPTNPANALTPAEALSQMFAVQRAKFDQGLLKAFIKCMGVYPPGSLVQLSNDMIGLVLSVNANHSLKPNVLVHDPDIPKDQAVVINLQDSDDLKIIKSLRPNAVPGETRDYLNPRKRVTYYFDPQTAKPGG
ncbi:HD-GYP domain-containing protein [Pseudomarimonas arenosa]|uniref:DUF3391 domain-containing protein n=1 Tax=Pseudomarimonas arenosa TaxID=2774145 RepID=A0AAW3ZD22_9GAMM|nr:DUF3391 domain-containing protein [Pseudomarimonas arenosa]MBD8524250.1 DUF3391 domain-containing protein [Pseudomarimonas arenosa]